jgi:hypothetical protein
MTLILDSGGIRALAGQRARLVELRRRGLWPPQVPAAVLVEALTGGQAAFQGAHGFVGVFPVATLRS